MSIIIIIKQVLIKVTLSCQRHRRSAAPSISIDNYSCIRVLPLKIIKIFGTHTDSSGCL